MLKRSLSIAATMPFLLGMQEPAFHDRQFRVSDIQIHLLYEESGRLSADISADPSFTAFNTIIGEGSAEENANDLLVTAVIEGPGEHNLATPLILTIRNEQGRVLARRRIAGMLAGERTFRSLAVYDAGCAGTLTVTAQLGASTRSEQVALVCGE